MALFVMYRESFFPFSFLVLLGDCWTALEMRCIGTKSPGANFERREGRRERKVE